MVWYLNVSWDDVHHLNEKAKADLIASYPSHELETRTKGVPMMGEGAVFPLDDEEISCEPFEVPRHFPRINGVDFGIDHPFACAFNAWDRDSDTWYVYDCYRTSGQTPVYHAAAIKKYGNWIPVAWPHDGMARDKGSGKMLKDQYREHGVAMLNRSSRYDEEKGGGQPVEPIVLEMYERMRTGRLKVFKNLSYWFQEKRMYHRKDGKIQPVRDDLLKATMYAMMDKRRASVYHAPVTKRPRYTGPIVGS